ncbi:hypothetical protein Gasu2_04900 [Galdieria sulphuraria]|uniref:Chromatin target of PRMT1 protein C-terminal domain-containing protein n=1 Tax=Galdieria sulphuraria TaxID=130081 RepID=M2W9A5_GALSU|nr:hypothetical protein Gasu_05340 isoform 1 [Galdieria sulphuraria]EME32451.1 hypothetical protein isoform 1 [Galdieria sulphuraria]GJD06052.1 hypothetical protein Gasu2_04900 [Galdieria sulphuraria]|eukprot:XP_005708971.1 hypothetical protein isoform 1 [Galdieria sulphuraria]
MPRAVFRGRIRKRKSKPNGNFKRRGTLKREKRGKTQEQLDAEIMLYQAEKEGRDKEEVKLEIEKMKREREKAKLDEEMDEYFKKRETDV